MPRTACSFYTLTARNENVGDGYVHRRHLLTEETRKPESGDINQVAQGQSWTLPLTRDLCTALSRALSLLCPVGLALTHKSAP